jgi:hypothetical protein
MLVAHLLDSSRKRVPWPTMRAIFKMCNLPIGHGWEGTVKKLTDEKIFGDEFITNFNQLKEYYRNHLLIGEKAVKFFHQDRDKIDKLINLLVSHEIEITAFHPTYPFTLADETL